MIIAAYAGVGKTYLANYRKDILDMEVRPFKYDFPEGEGLLENDKGGDQYSLVSGWERNYLNALKRQLNFQRHILIPTDFNVLDLLDEEHVFYVIVYPENSEANRREYERRFKARGNSDEFVEMFSELFWNMVLKGCSNRVRGLQMELGPEEYLFDVISKIDEFEDRIYSKYNWLLKSRCPDNFESLIFTHCDYENLRLVLFNLSHLFYEPEKLKSVIRKFVLMDNQIKMKFLTDLAEGRYRFYTMLHEIVFDLEQENGITINLNLSDIYVDVNSYNAQLRNVKAEPSILCFKEALRIGTEEKKQ